MVRVLGAVLIAAGCGGFGFAMAAANRREEAELVRLIAALEFMSCELSYRMTPLSVLCRRAAQDSGGVVRDFLAGLAQALEGQREPEVRDCAAMLLDTLQPPKLLDRQLRELGMTLGQFDLPGQLRGLEAAIRSAQEALRAHRDGAADRRRSCQTLGLCAGAAMAILFL